MHEFVPDLMFLFALLLISAFFSGSEASLFSLSKLEKKRLNDRHPINGKLVASLLESPRRTLITILMGNMIVNTIAIALVTSIAVQWFGPSGVGWTILCFTFVLVIVGELAPKVFAVCHNEWFAFVSALPLDIVARVFFPVRKII